MHLATVRQPAGIKLKFNEISEREINHLTLCAGRLQVSERASGSRRRRAGIKKRQPLSQQI
jgi:hypothetical protein